MLLLAGEGILPVLVKRRAEKIFTVVTVSCRLFKRHPELMPDYLLERLSFEELLSVLRMERPEALCLVGKVPKVHVFSPEVSEFFASCRSLQDRDVVEECLKILREKGFEVLSSFDFLQDLITPEGVLFGPPPTEEEWDDVTYGFRIARFLADEEIGQTVVVKRRTVVALEGAEGTDETIRRGLALSRGGIVVKVARSHQDFFVDVPAIGVETIRLLGEGGGRLIALESGKTLLLDRERIGVLAERFGITVLGVTL